MAGELAVFERYCLLRLVKHRRELEVGREFAVNGIDREAHPLPLIRVGCERSREPSDRRCGRGDDHGDEIRHAPIVARRPCMHRQRAVDTSDV